MELKPYLLTKEAHTVIHRALRAMQEEDAVLARIRVEEAYVLIGQALERLGEKPASHLP